MIYSFRCIICGQEFDLVQGMNDMHKAFHCGIEATRIYTVPYTNKDLMYQFRTSNITGKPIEIYSKRQYNRLLKENGLMTMTTEELRTLKQPKDFGKEKRKKLVKKVCKKLQEGGAVKDFPKFAEKYYTKGVTK